jgi:nucleoside-diphosphate-sugar epimerase
MDTITPALSVVSRPRVRATPARTMKALVLGATGHVGGAIAARLLARKDDVTLLVRDETRLSLAGDPKKRLGSILDPNAIARAAEGCDAIFCAVGAPSGAASRVYPWLYVAGVENVITAARHQKVPHVVLVTSADVTLANQDRVHWNEKRDISELPFGDRAQSIRLGEEIALALSDDRLSVSAIRPGWVWGPGDRSMLPELVREAKDGGITMWGEGKNLVATTYIDLVVDAAIAAAKSPSSGGQAYYVSDGEFLELREWLASFTRALGLPPAKNGTPFSIAWTMATLRGDVALREKMLRRCKATLFDAQKAQVELGVEPKTSIEQGLKALAAWVEAEGGIDAVAKWTRALPDAAAIEAEAKAAGLAEPPKPSKR